MPDLQSNGSLLQSWSSFIFAGNKNEMGATCVMYTQHVLFSRLGFHAKLGLNKISPTLQSSVLRSMIVYVCCCCFSFLFVCLKYDFLFVCLLFLV